MSSPGSGVDVQRQHFLEVLNERIDVDQAEFSSLRRRVRLALIRALGTGIPLFGIYQAELLSNRQGIIFLVIGLTALLLFWFAVTETIVFLYLMIRCRRLHRRLAEKKEVLRVVKGAPGQSLYTAVQLAGKSHHWREACISGGIMIVGIALYSITVSGGGSLLSSILPRPLLVAYTFLVLVPAFAAIPFSAIRLVISIVRMMQYVTGRVPHSRMPDSWKEDPQDSSSR